ncbi:MAG TPA: hypothetical protein VFY87_21630 [Geminicoccaceae bacterium]|jgi:hypothetical protein|nr:hypothetical protein [Geminicoccaceae bacterium]
MHLDEDETRAVAKLPHVDIEIRRKQAPDGDAEYLAISVRASPDFASAAAFFDPFRLADPTRLLAAWTAFNPWLAWLRLAGPLALPRLGGRDEGGLTEER